MSAGFASTNAPSYRALLAMCVRDQEQPDTVKRFDMPGFRPRPDWIREMRRYGILAADAAETMDCYNTARRYWQSLWPQVSNP